MSNLRINIINTFLLFFAIFPLIPNKIKGLPVAILFFVTLVFYKKGKAQISKLLVSSSLFLICFLSILYSDDKTQSFSKIETALSMLVLPLSFFLLLADYKITNSFRKVFFKLFIVSSSLFSLFSLLFFVSNSKYIYLIEENRRLITNMPLIGQHPIYASIFLSVSIFFFITLIKNNNLKYNKTGFLFFFLVLLNVCVLLLILSKGVVISLFFVLFVQVLNIQTLKRIKYVLVFVIISLLITLFIYNNRMNKLIKVSTYGALNTNSSTSIRLGIYDCSFKVIQNKLLFGHGIGDAQRSLNKCYANKSDILLMHRFNSHNQYLDVLIKTGVIGFLIFLFFLVYNLKHALKTKNNLLLMIVLFYSIVFFTENVLSRQSGVIFFFFLICLNSQFNLNLNTNVENTKPKPLQNSQRL